MKTTLEVLEEVSGMTCYTKGHRTTLKMDVSEIERAMKIYGDERVKTFSLNLSVNGSFSKEQMESAYKGGRVWFRNFESWWDKNFQ